MYGAILLAHVLAATIWAGGHLVLALAILPGALRENDVAGVQRFEAAFERVGLPALAVQVVTGPWLAYRLVPDIGRWLAPSDPVSQLVATKLLMLLTTVGLAVNARLRVIPRLDEATLPTLGWHIALVTSLAVGLVVVGVSFRTGWPF